MNGSISGDNIAYIYPDMETVFLGTFQNKLMRAARESEVKVWIVFWMDRLTYLGQENEQKGSLI